MKSVYKRMISSLKAKKPSRRRPKGLLPWSLYLLRCGDGSLYTGITNDVARRLGMHQKGKAARYTRTHPPVDLVYQEKVGTRSQALVREFEVKAYSRKRKEGLVLSQTAGAIR
jgi:putative endonuclease